jgi:catechol 2,3-dioxygenase-like lactoylglutathione lyase family enzyme
MQPDLNQIDFVVRDMEASIAFYRALGVDIPESAIWRTPSGIHHVDLAMPGGTIVHFDSPALARAYDRGWREPEGRGSRNVVSFRVASREDVDRLHAKLTALGHRCAQPPYDAFWGSRYAIVEDPDGNHIGLMSPRDDAKRSAPPEI